MIELLKNDLPVHYGLHLPNISVPSETTSDVYSFYSIRFVENIEETIKV